MKFQEFRDNWEPYLLTAVVIRDKDTWNRCSCYKDEWIEEIVCAVLEEQTAEILATELKVGYTLV